MEENNENVQLSEKEARKKRLRDRRMARRAKHNARVARCRLFKNLFIWFLGVIFLPLAIVGVSFVVPISVITGNSGENVSTELSNKSLFEAIKYVSGNYGELGFADFPIIGKSLKDLEDTDIGDGKTLGDVINIDTDKLNEIKFGSEGMADKVRECVEIIATLDSVGGTDMLGDFGTLNVFNDPEEVGTLAEIDTSAEDFDAKQYYYKTASDEYVRAFKDDGTYAEGLSGSQTVYYPPLAKVRIAELVNIIDDAFGRLEINSLLETFHASNATLTKILGEHTKVKDLSDFDIKGVCLNDVMPKDGNNEKLYDILEDLTENTYDVITIGDLSENFDTDSIKLTTVIPNNSNSETIYNILSGALNKTAENITIGDLSSEDFDINKVLLIDVLTLDDDMYDILCGAVDEETKPTKETITIGHLSHIDIDIVPLDTILDLNEDDTLNKVLKAAVVGTGADGEILLGDLITGFDINSVPLDTILTLDEDDTLNKVLKAAVVGTGTDGEILLGDLTTGFDINSVPLDTILDLNEDDTLNKVLKAAVVGTGADGEILLGDLTTGFDINSVPLNTVLTLDEDDTLNKILNAAVVGTGTDGEILLGDLTTGFDINSVPLDTVLTLDEDSTLNKILKSAVVGTGTDGEILLGDLTTGFDINSVPLNTVLEGVDLTGNSVLTALREQDITISEIGTALNELSLYEVYGKTAFIEIEDGTEVPLGARRFNKDTDVEGRTYFEYDADGDYYLKDNAGIWLILCFDTAEYDDYDNVITRYKDADGNPYKYVVDDMKIEDLQAGSGFSRKFKNSTLKQLIDTGLVDDTIGLSNEIKALSLQEIIAILADPGVQAYIAATH